MMLAYLRSFRLGYEEFGKLRRRRGFFFFANVSSRVIASYGEFYTNFRGARSGGFVD